MGVFALIVLGFGLFVIFLTWWKTPKDNRSTIAIALGAYCVLCSTGIYYHSAVVPESFEAWGLKVKAGIKEVGDSEVREIQAKSEAQEEKIKQLVNQAEQTRKELAQQADKSQELLADLKKISQQLAWRKLSPPRRDQLRRALAAATPASVEVLYTAADDPEIAALAQQLFDVLKEAGWKVEDGLFGLSGLPVEGIQIRVSDPARPPTAAIILKDALKAVGLPSSIVKTQPGLPQAREVVLIVGAKPRPVAE